MAIIFNGGQMIMTQTSGSISQTMNFGSSLSLSQTVGSINQQTIISSAVGTSVLVGSDNADNLMGGSGNDVLNGLGGADNLMSGGGNDLLFGGDGNDNLNGGSGNDILDGGAGNDLIIGGSGSDIFQFMTVGSIDSIADFSVIDDTIQLENAAFTSLVNTGVLNADSLRVGVDLTSAADANDFLIYNSSTGGLYYDAGGNTVGSATAVQIALLGTNLALTNADFFVI
jgi:Ca2+-binding RTX toxin-like protein